MFGFSGTYLYLVTFCYIQDSKVYYVDNKERSEREESITTVQEQHHAIGVLQNLLQRYEQTEEDDTFW